MASGQPANVQAYLNKHKITQLFEVHVGTTVILGKVYLRGERGYIPVTRCYEVMYFTLSAGFDGVAGQGIANCSFGLSHSETSSEEEKSASCTKTGTIC